MGVVFDAREYKNNDKGHELRNNEEMSRFKYILESFLSDEGKSDKAQEYKLSKTTIVIKSKNRREARDPDFNTLKFKGSFGNFDPSRKKTWKSAVIEKINYEGRDGIIKVKSNDKQGSLGTIHEWDRLWETEKFEKSMFKGDDIIHGSKFNDVWLKGFDGNDTIYMHESFKTAYAEGGKGKDNFIVTKNAFNKISSKNNFHVSINDVSSSQGDSVEVHRKASVFGISELDKERGGSGLGRGCRNCDGNLVPKRRQVSRPR